MIITLRTAIFSIQLFVLYMQTCSFTVVSLDVCDVIYGNLENTREYLDLASTEIKKHIFYSHLPKAGSKAGKYSKLKDIAHWEECLNACCPDDRCDVMLFTIDQCYHIECATNPPDSCQPVVATSSRHNSTVMVVRSAVNENDLHSNSLTKQPAPTPTSPPTPSSLTTTTRTPAASSSASSTPSTKQSPPKKLVGETCTYGLLQCVENAECIILPNSVSKEGHCGCKEGYIENLEHGCQQVILNKDSAVNLAQPTTNEVQTTAGTTKSTTPAITKLTVSAGTDKVIQLPENSVVLTAFVLPKPEQGETFTYEWTPVTLPEKAETATMDGKNTDSLKLSNLIAGLYVFKIKVTGLNKFGEALVNVTVLPPKRQNQPPHAIIHRPTQEVYLPNVAILDGSESTDDDKIVSYKWEEVSGPLQGHELNQEGQMLTLKDLVPGNYTFRLTVTDSDGVTNSTSANVTVHKEKDYPPKADAGSDVVIHLPQTSLILYGNNSADDKGQLEYEWIKVSDDKLTVGMTGVRSPFLQLSNLVVGDYKFTLKVTDSARQTDSADVQVFVKPETNHPPVAKTAGHISLYLPQDSLTLDGTNSTDDLGKLEYQWTQKGGPATLTITNADKVIAIATGKITEGDYEFQLTVTDGERQQSSDTLVVSVKKDVNLPPKANAGGNKVVQVPVSLVTLDGSKSSDDRGIAKYLWQRDSKSLAAGTVVNNSDHMAVLQLMNLVAGQYLFTLTVEDTDGLSSSDTATISVNKNPNEKDIVELILDADIDHFTMANKESLVDQLELLLQKSSEDRNIDVQFISIVEDVSTGHLCIRFQVLHTEKGVSTIMTGKQALQTLKTKVSIGKILEYSIIRLDLAVCQNNCSGHGHCDQKSKQCICEAFWMSNLFTANKFGVESNCDWSILYVVIILFVVVVAVISAIWTIICCFSSKKCKMKLRGYKRQKYTLLKDMENKDRLEMTSKSKMQNSSVMMSESELSSDEETLFISHKKASNGINGKISTGTKASHRNGLKT